MHAVEHAVAIHALEAIQQKRLQEPSGLRFAAGQHAIDPATERVRGAGGIRRLMREKISRVTYDREARAFNETFFASGAGERWQVGSLAQFPPDFGEAEAVIFEEAGPLT